MRLFDRIFQFLLYIGRPFLPWRIPEVLDTYEALSQALLAKNKRRPLIVIDNNLVRLGIHKPLINSLKEHGIRYDLFTDISPNPTINQVEKAFTNYFVYGSDAVIGLGGGSSIDVAKALAARIANPKKSLDKMGGLFKVRRKLDFLAAIPTTAGTGSEATLAAVIVNEKTKRKYTINDFPLIPHYAVLIPDLTLNLPPFFTATTGMDALTHAIEAYTNNGGTKFTNSRAINAVKLIFKYLPLAYKDPINYEARQMMQVAAFDAGVAFTRNYVGYVHALSHPLSAYYGLPHGYVNALILPFMLAKYGSKVERKLARLARNAEVIPLGLNDKDTAALFIEKINDFNSAFNIKKTIPEIEINDIPQLAKYANKEARPLYPTPVIYKTNELEMFYRQLKGELT